MTVPAFGTGAVNRTIVSIGWQDETEPAAGIDLLQSEHHLTNPKGKSPCFSGPLYVQTNIDH